MCALWFGANQQGELFWSVRSGSFGPPNTLPSNMNPLPYAFTSLTFDPVSVAIRSASFPPVDEATYPVTLARLLYGCVTPICETESFGLCPKETADIRDGLFERIETPDKPNGLLDEAPDAEDAVGDVGR